MYNIQLHKAIKNNFPNIVRNMIRNGAHINNNERDGFDYLNFAINNNNWIIVEIILDEIGKYPRK